MTIAPLRYRVLWCAACAVGLFAGAARAQDGWQPENRPADHWTESAWGPDGKDPAGNLAPTESYDPGVGNVPRAGAGLANGPGTLFQWSYGTSFSGGPSLDEPLVTDRPDFTEASSTVGKGVLQLEAGYTYTYDADGTTSTRAQSFGEPLFRYGVRAEWLEFRVQPLPAEQQVSAGGIQRSTAGTADLYLGFKLGLTPQEGIFPEMGLIPQTTVPTGSRAFTDEQVLPGVNWIYSWEIDDCLSTAGSTQVNRAVDGGTAGTYYEFAQSWTAAYSLTDKLGAYTEWFALIPSGADTARTQHYFNGGFTFLLDDDVQLDVRGGKGLNAAADDYFFGAGVSIRFR